MSSEQAMEQYISLLSESIPCWIAEKPYVSVFNLVSFSSVGLNVMNQSSFIILLLNLPI